MFNKDVSDRTRFMMYALRSPRYGVEYGNIMLIYLICFAFSVICPVVLPFGTVFFAGMWLFWR